MSTSIFSLINPLGLSSVLEATAADGSHFGTHEE